MTQIAVPKSLQFYFASLENARSIDRLIDSRDSKAPETVDMSWEDLSQFYQAQLAAFKTQVDYWQFCDDVWRKVWGKALEGVPAAKEQDWDWYEQERSVESVWNASMYRSHQFTEGTLLTHVSSDTEFFLIGFSYEFADGSFELLNDLPLSDNWDKNEETERYLRNGLISFRGHSTLDISLAQKEAEAAIAALKKWF